MENKRIIAFFIDFIIASIIQSILMGIFVIRKVLFENIEVSNIFLTVFIISYVSMMYMVFRDCIGIKSIGKRIMKINIIDKKTHNNASYKQRLFRNITWLLGPIELIYYLLKNERLGDLIAKTEVSVIK